MICAAVIAATLLSTAEHPLQPQLDRFFANQKSAVGFQPTGLKRAAYLKLVDGEVRALRKYQKPDGDLPDPVDGRSQFGPPCYAHSVATLAASGFNTDPQLLESGMRAMDFSVACLAQGMSAFRDKHPDFYTYPVMLALEQFEKVAPKERLAAWRKQLAAINPAKTYAAYNKGDNNWTLVHTAGEFLRSLHGLTDCAYVGRALEIQRPHMTSQGLYLEHGAPLAYDAFSRYFLTGMLQRGYRDDFYRDACWKGAWTSLLIQSPFGELPTGYRSAQHLWNEAELAKVYEIYAAQYAQAGRLAEAGTFKRGARLALASMQQWLRADGSGYIVKNRYPIEARHGYEGYSVHVNYNLLACSMLCAAWQNADDAIEEKPAPADVGGFVVHLPDFNMIVANAGGNYVQYMTRGNGKYNPSGLVRVHLRGGHPQLGYSDGILRAAPPATNRVEVLEESPTQVRFRCGETVTINAEGATVATSAPIRFPMLVFDGREETRVTLAGPMLRLDLAGRAVQVALIAPATATWQRTGQRLKQRNGLVEEAFAEGTDYRISVPKEP
ncbi:MAG: hypothetical protein NTY53_10940 [Kiritimatiellaeota bacterium]|nr:hypothetical protein [Kiritimatiellota bacterium]